MSRGQNGEPVPIGKGHKIDRFHQRGCSQAKPFPARSNRREKWPILALTYPWVCPAASLILPLLLDRTSSKVDRRVESVALLRSIGASSKISRSVILHGSSLARLRAFKSARERINCSGAIHRNTSACHSPWCANWLEFFATRGRVLRNSLCGSSSLAPLRAR